MANKEVKAALVDELADRLSRSSIAILTDYRGLTVAEISELRRKLRAARVDYQVAKNTLVRLAAERAQKTALSPDLVGPTAIAFGYEDPVDAAKALQDYLRTSRVLTVKSAMLGDRRLEPSDVQALAELPARPQLQARLVGTIQGPMAALIGAMDGLLRQLVYVIDQRAQQLGEPAVAPAEQPEQAAAEAAADQPEQAVAEPAAAEPAAEPMAEQATAEQQEAEPQAAPEPSAEAAEQPVEAEAEQPTEEATEDQT